MQIDIPRRLSQSRNWRYIPPPWILPFFVNEHIEFMMCLIFNGNVDSSIFFRQVSFQRDLKSDCNFTPFLMTRLFYEFDKIFG